MPTKSSTAPLVAVPSPRAQLSEWVRDEITGVASVSVPELTDRAVAHFVSDQAFVTRFMQEALRPMVYELVRSIMAQTRGAGEVIVLGDEITTKADVKERSKGLAGRWANWLEHVGDKHVKLSNMTKVDLVLAASERRRRGDAEYELAALWEALAERLEGVERVGERFTAHEIERVRADIAARKAEKK